MPIDWRALTDGPLPLDYYAVTVRGGAVAAQKVYYRTDAAQTGLPPFDGLCAAGLLRPFSFGTDDAGHKKYDFALTREFRAVCHAVAREYPFFDAARVIALDALMQRLGAETGKIAGVKMQGGEQVVRAGVHALQEGEKVNILAPASETNVGGLL